MGNPVVHFEIGPAEDQRLVKFYGELFGWKPQPIPGGSYTIVDTQGGASAQISPAERERLFQQFLEWQQTRGRRSAGAVQ